MFFLSFSHEVVFTASTVHRACHTVSLEVYCTFLPLELVVDDTSQSIRRSFSSCRHSRLTLGHVRKEIRGWSRELPFGESCTNPEILPVGTGHVTSSHMLHHRCIPEHNKLGNQTSPYRQQNYLERDVSSLSSLSLFLLQAHLTCFEFSPMEICDIFMILIPKSDHLHM